MTRHNVALAGILIFIVWLVAVIVCMALEAQTWYGLLIILGMPAIVGSAFLVIESPRVVLWYERTYGDKA